MLEQLIAALNATEPEDWAAGIAFVLAFLFTVFILFAGN